MIFGLGPVELAILVGVGWILEIALLWAATGLMEAPETGLLKLAAISLGVFLSCFALSVGVAYSFGVLFNPLALDHRGKAVAALAISQLIALVAPGLLYPSLFAINLRKGIWVSVLQWLLRIFLYILIVAVLMVVLAVWQILRGPSGS
ncbi:MAG: hypothetical protein SNJ82_09570 [Gemmataceae bacterium]